jgi:hypothetical protein
MPLSDPMSSLYPMSHLPRDSSGKVRDIPYAWVRHHAIRSALGDGWMVVIPNEIGLYADQFSVLMAWVCCCGRAMPVPR